MQSWLADPTPVCEIDETSLRVFTLEDNRRRRKITTKGIGFGPGRHYVADWMVGLVGTAVRIRYMPHHTEEVEVFDTQSGCVPGRGGTGRVADGHPSVMCRLIIEM